MASDTPVDFGENMAWYAVKHAAPEQLATLLKLKQLCPTTWRDGLASIYRDYEYNDERAWSRVFITPKLNDWTLVVGWWAMSHKQDVGLRQMTDICKLLSTEFGEAQNFGGHAKVEYYQWLLAKNGRMVRSFEYLEGEVLSRSGDPTEAELSFNWSEEQNNWKPTRRDLFNLAGRWSINPTLLSVDTYTPTGIGYLAETAES